VTLLPLRSGGLLADTPGFGYPSLQTLTPTTLGRCFPEIRDALERGRCKFANCTHRDEPGCAVDAEEPWEEGRYDAYADLFDECEAIEKQERERGYARESTVRYKSGKGGKGGGGRGRARGAGSLQGVGGGRGGALAKGAESSRGGKSPGAMRMEAKLETKTHRRQSRRARNMETAARTREAARDEEAWREATEDAVAAEFGEEGEREGPGESARVAK
jgi:ribosome biogenesis GTPase